MRRPHILGLVALITAALGCSDECACPLGATCDVNGVCQLACIEDSDCEPLECAADAACCSGSATCVSNECLPDTVSDALCGPPPAVSDGWQAAPGSGEAYLLNDIEVATACPSDAPCNNALTGLSQVLSSLFRSAIVGGDARVLVEVTGRQRDRVDFDRSLTLRMFRGADADVPENWTNDFGPIGDSQECCAFVVAPSSEARGPSQLLEQAAQLRRGRLSMVDTATSVVLPVSVYTTYYRPLEFYRARISLQVSATGEFDEFELWAELRPYDLWQIPASFCVGAVPSDACPRSLPEGATFLDAVIAAAGSPHVDADGDGLECLLDSDDDGALDRCCEGSAVPNCNFDCIPIAPVHMSAASSCALSDALADTYSVGLRGRLIPATLLSNR